MNPADLKFGDVIRDRMNGAEMMTVSVFDGPPHSWHVVAVILRHPWLYAGKPYRIGLPTIEQFEQAPAADTAYDWMKKGLELA